MNAPSAPLVLETAGLRLRLPSSADQVAWDEVRYLPDVQPLGIGSVVEELARWTEHRYGLFAVEDLEGRILVGIVGIAPPFRCAGPHLLGAMHPRWRGLDGGREETRSVEGSRAVVSWWHDSQSGQLFAHVEPENEKGKRLARALGGEPVQPMDGYFPDKMADFAFCAR